MKLTKTILKIFLICFMFFSCVDEPEYNHSHTLYIDGNVPGANYAYYIRGTSGGTSADSDGDMTLTIINSEPELIIDSITGEKTGYTKWKVINQIIGEYKSYTVILEEIK